ncbi:MAG: hypothetical protein NXI30_00990 [bacterium]|nr:hypothetical protein [bacterium]
MANLLPRSQAPFPALTEAERARVETRARFALGTPWTRLRSFSADAAHALAAELDELDEAPSLPVAQALLAELDTQRAERVSAVEAVTSGLRGLLFRPGRSLRSGEAEAASRGFFDVADRPPPLLWLEAVARPRATGSDEIEIGLLCGVPGDALERAAAGVSACVSGALTWTDDATAGIVSTLPGRIDGR